MSFPPRPPMMPGIMVPPFTYAPMSMMPIGMMPVPGMMRPGMPMQQIHQMTHIRPPTFGKHEVTAPPMLNKPPEEKLPVTTVFVGNIHDKAPDAMIKLMLQKCGNVLSWKRVQGASGKLQAFGFCEYDNPEATLRCIRLLNDWIIVDKKLLVKVDAKTSELLEEYKKKREEKRKANKEKEKEEGEENSDDESEDAEQNKDQEVKNLLLMIIKDHEADLHKVITDNHIDDTDKKQQGSKQKKTDDMPPLNLEGMELEDDIKNLVNREIRSFRDAHLNSEQSRDNRDRDRDGRRKRDDDREKERQRDRDREKERERERPMNAYRERERERERDRERERREREREREREKERAIKSRSKTRDRSPVVHDKRVKDKDGEIEDEEVYERKKLERRLREKEAAYQELLRKWESRERKKSREYEKERSREKDRRSEEIKESKRLREFLEDYNDERDDVKYYKGSALQRRLHEREKELEADERDRRREREELEEIRKKLQEQGHPDLESEMARIEREREEHLLPRIPFASQTSPTGSESPVIVLDPDNDHADNTHQSPRHFPSSYFYKEGQENNDEDDARQNNSFSSASTLRPINLAPKVTSPPSGKLRTAVDYSPSGAEESSQSPSGLSNGGLGNISDSNLHRIERGESRRSNNFGYSSDDSRGPNLQGQGDIFSPVTVSKQMKQKTPSKQKDYEGSNNASPKSASEIKRKRAAVADIFNADEDEEETNQAAKKRRLTLLDMSDEEKSASSHALSLGGGGGSSAAPSLSSSAPTTAEEKRKWIKNFIEKIPTRKKELFSWKVNWSLVDQDLIDKRIKPWVNKKVMEYIGEDEPSLTDFICKKVHSHTPPDTILSDISMVLDDEAEVFVMKMWRLLIYEIEAKKHGVR